MGGHKLGLHPSNPIFVRVAVTEEKQAFPASYLLQCDILFLVRQLEATENYCSKRLPSH